MKVKITEPGWSFNGLPFGLDDVKSDDVGFSYLITNKILNKHYIGKKLFWSHTKLPPLKSSGLKRKRKVTKPSDWLSYWSSSDYVKQDLATFGPINFSREILFIHKNKTENNYTEQQLLISLNVLDALDENGNKKFYNANYDRIVYPSEVYGEKRTQNLKIIKEMNL